MILSMVKAKGVSWFVCRGLYEVKLKTLRLIPASEKLYEKRVGKMQLRALDIDADALCAFLRALPECERNALVSRADAAAQGRLAVFSGNMLDYGDPIDFHRNPVNGALSDKDKKWFKIADFEQARGDIKLFYEVSRFSQAIDFARAYLLTNDEKYYRAYASQVKRFLSENRYSYGLNYKCGQECALRMMNVFLAYSVFSRAGADVSSSCADVEKFLSDSYKKVLANHFYAKRCIRNNHTLSELCGMMLGAWLEGNEARLARACRSFDEEARKQFFSDGGYIQFSFTYQRVALQLFEFAAKLSKQTGARLSNATYDVFKKAALLMYQCCDVSGDMPNFGSNDGALFFPVTAASYRDFTPQINAVYAIAAGKRLFDAGIRDEELIWFADKNAPLENVEKVSSAFAEQGVYTLRNGGAFVMTVLGSAKRQSFHMDQLHVDVWRRGQNIFCDSGTYSYAEPLGAQLAATCGHNTVKIDGLEQKRSAARFVNVGQSDAADITHDAAHFSGRMAGAEYSHKREVTLYDSSVGISDEVATDKESVKYLFHTPLNCSVDGFRVTLSDDDGKNLAVLCAPYGSEISVSDGKRSLYYMRADDCRIIAIKRGVVNGADSARFTLTLL